MVIMSFLVREVYREAVNRTTGNTERLALIIADDVASLPVNTSSMTYILGSEARIVADGSKYIMNSSGTWVLQPSDNQFENVYTKAETDALLTPLSNQLDSDTDALVNLINSGGKNRFNATGTTQSARGFTITNNGNGTFTINGTRTQGDTSAVWFSLGTINLNGHYFLSGTTTNKARLTANVYGVAQYDNGDGADLNGEITGTVYCNIPGSVTSLDNVIIKPMICSIEDWGISHEFEPYCPTLAELYALVRSYHP